MDLSVTSPSSSGDYYESLFDCLAASDMVAAMVVSPILRGLFGLETDAE